MHWPLMREILTLIVGAFLLLWWIQTAGEARAMRDRKDGWGVDDPIDDIDAAGDGCLWVAILVIVGGGMLKTAQSLAGGG